jgi:nucleotide-binding universal stress UspA family protein
MTLSLQVTEQAQPKNNATFLVCVSDQAEAEVAVRFTCLRAKRRGAQVQMLHVVEPEDFTGLFSVSEIMLKEKEEKAQQLLRRMADLAMSYSEMQPTLTMREGKLSEQILAATLENSDIIAVVLGVRHNSMNAPKLISWLTARMGQEMLVPLILVPGNLTDAQIDLLV